MIELLWQEGQAYLYLLFSLFLGWIGWSLKKRFVPREEHERLSARVDLLENAMSHLPSAKEINALRGQLTEVSSDLKVFNQRHIAASEKFDRLERQVDRIERYLMEKAK